MHKHLNHLQILCVLILQVYMAADKVWRPEVTLVNPSTAHNFFGDITRLLSFHTYNGEASFIIGNYKK